MVGGACELWRAMAWVSLLHEIFLTLKCLKHMYLCESKGRIVNIDVSAYRDALVDGTELYE